MSRKHSINWNKFNKYSYELKWQWKWNKGKFLWPLAIIAGGLMTYNYGEPALEYMFSDTLKEIKEDKKRDKIKAVSQDFGRKALYSGDNQEIVIVKAETTLEQLYPPQKPSHSLVFNMQSRIVTMNGPDETDRTFTFKEFDNNDEIERLITKGCSLSFNLPSKIESFKKLHGDDFQHPKVKLAYSKGFIDNYCTANGVSKLKF